MHAVTHELKQAARGLVAQPGFSLLVIGVLTAGLTCVVYMLIAIGSMILRPLPFVEPQQLHYTGLDDGNVGGGPLDPLRAEDLLTLRRHLDGRIAVAGFATGTINLSDLDRPERYDGAFVSANLFQVLGVAPHLGRDFNADDERAGAAPVVMLSHALWTSRYGGDPAVVGREVRVNAQRAMVVGVMPEDFSYPRREHVWTLRPLAEGASNDSEYTVVLRGGASTSLAGLEAAVGAWFSDAARAAPERFRDVRIRVEPLGRLAINSGTRAVLGIMLTAVLLVLLVACANAANLLLTRTLGRRQELAVRVALGASRARLIVHLLAQSLLLTLIAVAIAIPLALTGAAWTERAFNASDDGQPMWMHFTLDATIVWMTLAAAVFTALAAGLLPALRAGGAALAGDLRDGSRGATGSGFARISRVLVVGEVALSCALLIAVGTLVRGIAAIDRSDLGIDTTGILTARIGLFPQAYPDGADQVRAFERITARLREDAAVIDATAGTNLPALNGNRRAFAVDGAATGDGPLPQLLYGAVDDHFLDAYALRLREGRFFDERDTVDAPRVAVVDERFAAQHGGNAVLGKRFTLSPRSETPITVSVVGVVGAMTMNEPGSPVRPAMLVPLRQNPARFVSLAVRVRGEPAAFAPRLAELIREVDADTPAYWVRTYEKAIREATFTERLLARVFAAFGLVALVLAGAGLYGVMAFTVGQRTREIGVRRALGASAGSVLRDIGARFGIQLALGLGLGLALGIPFARQLSGALNRIDGGFSLVVPAALLALSIAAVLAVALPVRRALRVDPMVALRHE